jgi:superfamily II RNA helicase
MVKICSYNYPKSREETYKSYYEKYSYELHDFQKWSVEATVTGNHVLICCPTGSGKTFGGEFALNYFHSLGKKTIYCSPIKALSNEKYHSFSQKYPHITFGLITGDIKTNPNADVLIMTTEILLNKLYQIKSSSPNIVSSVSFDMDIMIELGCVIFDEIHFINDEHRGHVWEQSIMLLPPHIQMVGLSATLDEPEKFALWLETKGDNSTLSEKEVYLTKKQIRAVPLIHYSFITVPNAINKVVKDKATQEEIRQLTNKLFVIQDEKNVFNDTHYQNMNRMLKLFEKNDVRVKRQHVLNQVSQLLVEKEMLPALCYVFSRKQLEICAEELTTDLLEFDSKISYTVDRECEQIIRKLPNYQEYLKLPEYVNTVKLLRKGVGIHHAGLMPILREMTELLFAKGYIKILFCTETMSIGINLPVKTTIFTDVNKFNGDINRMLYSHEYTQAAGRAGRLGLDSVGHVIHLNNLFRNVDSVSYKQMMNGKPQKLVSKFKISYNLILNLIDIGETDFNKYVRKSMIQDTIDNEMKDYYVRLGQVQNELNTVELIVNRCKTPVNVVERYIQLKENRLQSVNKKRKEIERELQSIISEFNNVEKEVDIVSKMSAKKREIEELNAKLKNVKQTLSHNIDKILTLFKTEGFADETNTLSIKGRIASNLREVHCLVFADLVEQQVFRTFEAKELVGILSCFTNVSIPEDKRSHSAQSANKQVSAFSKKLEQLYIKHSEMEASNWINTGFDYSMNFDLIDFMIRWCESENETECKLVLQEVAHDKEVFLGEFVKSILKINNITCELEKVAEQIGDIELLHKLKQVPHLTLKYVATNQSLYV